MFSCRKRKPKSNGAIFFIFLALVSVLLLLAFVMSFRPNRRIAIDDRPVAPSVPTAEISLPSEIVGSVSSLEIGSRSDNLVAVAYQEGGQQILGVVRHGDKPGQQELLSRTIVRGGFDHVVLPKMKAVSTGWGKDSVIELRWPLSEGNFEAVTFVQLDGTKLKQVRLQSSDGITRYEQIVVGDTEIGLREIVVRDFDGDGVSELMVIVTNEDGNKSYSVFFWSGGKLVWNEPWSDAMQSRDGLYEEPVE